MSNPYVVVENGTIECCHGGKVILKSSVPNLVIGGKKPLYNIDLIGAPIQGCPHRKSVNGHCKKVVSISDATTEGNVGGAGTNFLLRIDGCQTDKGYPLVLVDPGQANHRIFKKSSGPESQLHTEVLAIDPKEAAIPEPNETCRFHPLRQDGTAFKPLRGTRLFRSVAEYFEQGEGAEGPFTFDKIVTGTGGFLYVTFEDVTTEYRVVNRGDFCAPTIGEVFFQETQTRKIRTGIPFFKNEGRVEFVYSDLRLGEKDIALFPPTVVDVAPSEKQCLNDYSEMGKFIAVESKKLRKKLLVTGEEAREASDKPVAVVVGLLDPVGEVQDRFYEYEYVFKRHYAQNLNLFNAIREANRLPYLVAQTLDYVYVSPWERTHYDKQRKDLKQCYKQMRDYVLYKGGADSLSIVNNDLAKAIDFTVAQDYLDETRFMDTEVIGSLSQFSMKIKGEYHHYEPDYMPDPEYPWDDRKLLDYTGTGSKKPADVLALAVFSLAYSPDYACPAELKELSEKYYYLLKTSRPLPQLNDEALKEGRDELDSQSALTNIFEGTVPLMQEFEGLDTLHMYVAYDPAAFKGGAKGFSALKVPSKLPEVFHDADLQSAASIAAKASKLLGGSDLAERLKAYRQVEPKGADATGFYYCRTLMSIGAMLMAPEQPLDDKSRLLSPFNNANKAVAELFKHIAKTQETLDEETALKLHDEKVKEYYLDALYTYISHAYTEKAVSELPEVREKASWFDKMFKSLSSDDGRRENVAAFLDAFAADPDPAAPTFTKLLDNNFDRDLKLKTDSEKLYESLKKLNGLGKYVGKAEGVFKARDEVNSNRYGTRDIESVVSQKVQALRNSTTYQKLLVRTKALAFFMTAVSVAEFVQGKKRLDFANVTGFVSDTLSLSRQMAEYARDRYEKMLKAAEEAAKAGKPVAGPGKAATRLGLAGKKAAEDLPEKIEHLLRIDKLVSPSHMKTLSRFGLVGVIAGAANDIVAMDVEDNRDFAIATGVKNGIYVALLFLPGAGWVAFAAGTAIIAVTELVWFFVSEHIRNSKLELYFYDSLLFNAKEHNANRTFNEQAFPNGLPFRATVLLESLRSSDGDYLQNGKSVPASRLEAFKSADAVRTFVADNALAHPHAFRAALENELGLLKSALYGYTVEKNGNAVAIPMSSHGATFHARSTGGVTLSQALYVDARALWLSYDKSGANGYETHYERIATHRDYDIAAYLLRQSGEMDKVLKSMDFANKSPREQKMIYDSLPRTSLVSESLKNVHLIAVTEKAVVKVAVPFEVTDLGANVMVNIERIRSAGVSDEDLEKVKKD